MTADERRRKAIEGYYKAYREYKKLDTVREHMRVEMSGDTLIEIHLLLASYTAFLFFTLKNREKLVDRPRAF